MSNGDIRYVIASFRCCPVERKALLWILCMHHMELMKLVHPCKYIFIYWRRVIYHSPSLSCFPHFSFSNRYFPRIGYKIGHTTDVQTGWLSKNVDHQLQKITNIMNGFMSYSFYMTFIELYLYLLRYCT